MLAFDTSGNLLPGIHEATLEQVHEHFGRFQSTSRRVELYVKLTRYVEELRGTGWPVAVVLDGSFVMTGVNEPNDIDLILVFPADWDLAADRRPFEYNLVSKRRVKAVYGFDLFTVREGSPAHQDWIEFFSRVSPRWCELLGVPRTTRKGLVRIVP